MFEVSSNKRELSIKVEKKYKLKLFPYRVSLIKYYYVPQTQIYYKKTLDYYVPNYVPFQKDIFYGTI